MDTKEFFEKYDAAPLDEMDDLDKEMIASAEKHKDDPGTPLETILERIEKRRQKITVRLPKSLYKQLVSVSADEGVSLNQCILHQISTGVAVNYH